MRRPRAFTCSRLRAEPLPPPPRKPLGYLHEEGWAIARSSSPCKCGTCGRDSPLSTPPSNSHGGDSVRSTEARTFSNMHPWRPSGGTPPRAESPGASLDSRARENSTARVSASRRTPFPADRSAKPARRIVLFNTQSEPLGVAANAAAGVSSVGPAERKRASDGAGGDGGSACGEASSVSWAAYTLAATTAAASNLSANPATYSGAIINRSAMDATAAINTINTTAAGPTASTSASPAPASAATAAFSSAAPAFSSSSGGACEGRKVSNVAAGAGTAAASAEMFVPTFGPLSLASDPIDQAQALTPGDATMTITPKVHDRSSEGFVKGLDEWKAPETAGTFSLGASSQASGVGRRRRALRLRVGG